MNIKVSAQSEAFSLHIILVMTKSLTALAIGTFALGIAEFTMMGILGDVARSLDVSIVKAGHLISAYALGVAVGSPC